MKATELIVLKFFAELGWEIMRSITGDGLHSAWTAKHPERGGIIMALELNELFDKMTDDAFCLHQILHGVSMKKDTDETLSHVEAKG